MKFERGKKFTFTLNVTVKPTYELTSYEPVEITVPPFTFDEDSHQPALEEIAKNSVTYVVAMPSRLRRGTPGSIAMKCFDDGEEIKALTCEDRTYLMGRGYMPRDSMRRSSAWSRARPRSSPSRPPWAPRTGKW